MKYYYLYKNQVINIGDTTEDGVVEIFSGDRITIRKDDGTTVVFRANGPNYTRVECPPIAVYDRITGARLRNGSTTSTGAVIKVIYADCVQAELAGEVIWLELAPAVNHVTAGVELVKYPEFAHLESRTRITNAVTGEENMVSGVRGKLLPAADCIFIDDHYRLISDYKVLAINRQFVKRVPDDHVLVVGGVYASNSESVLLTACAHTGEHAYLYDVYALPDGTVCMLDETVRVRDRDGETRSLDTSGYEMVDGIAYAAGALQECASGDGSRHWRIEMRRYDGRYYGNEWFNRNARSCSNCGAYYIGDSHSRCESCRTEGKYRIHSYSNRDANYFKPELDVKIKFGIELEVGCDRGTRRTTCAKTMVDAIATDEYVVLKEDGSISECSGFEIVTRPDAPEVHKRIWANALSVPEVRQQMSSWTNGKCGIHIHVSRAPLSDLWVGRMLVLINADKMQPLVHAVAGRGSSSYTKYIKKQLTDAAEDNRSGDRYEALNTSGDHTIEFRIFRGTLEPAGFMKNIEFVEAVLAYCRPASRSLFDMNNPDKFIEFVSKSRKDYPSLHEFIEKKCTR